MPRIKHEFKQAVRHPRVKFDRDGPSHIEYNVLKIGNVSIQSRIFLAPMAGIADYPYRLICRSFGCELAFTEMVSARSLVHQSVRSERMLRSSHEDRPLGIQLLGNDTDSVLRAMDLIRPGGFSIIDLNAACPVEKITKKGKGSSLLREPLKLKAILAAMVRHSATPVTVKIRSGWDNDSINASEVALHAEDAGVSAVTLHGRTKMHGYGGSVDYDVIRGVKESLKIPVIASGDAFSPRLIKKLFDETGCDAVAIARGSLGNPWIFRDTVAYLAKAEVAARPSPGEIADTMLRHLDLNCGFYGEMKGTVLFRKLFAWYVKGLHDVRPLKEEAFSASAKQEMTALIERIRTYGYRHHDGNYEGYSLPVEAGV